MREERTKLEPRWLYVTVGAFVLLVVTLFVAVLVAAGLFVHEMNDVMAGF